MQYDFDQLHDRRTTECVKWHQYQDEVLPMWIADMDFRSPQPVIRALQERVGHGVFGYPRSGHPELQEIFAQRLEERFRWQVKPQEVVLLPGVVPGFNLVCHSLAGPGGGVFVQTPVYHPILAAAEVSGSIRQEMELTTGDDGTYEIDLDEFASGITDETRVFLLCNPHNPVGRVFRRSELERMAEICLRKNVILCSDEIHSDLVFSDHSHTPTASIDPEIAQQTITLMSPSKTFNLAGLRCAFAVIQNPKLMEIFQKAQLDMVGEVNLLGQVAALAAYQEGAEWEKQLLAYLEANRDFLAEYVRDLLPGIHMNTPEGTYLAWLDCRQSGIEGNPYEFFLKSAGVAVSDGPGFGKGGEGFVRLNFGCPRSMLTEALERMAAALAASPPDGFPLQR